MGKDSLIKSTSKKKEAAKKSTKKVAAKAAKKTAAAKTTKAKKPAAKTSKKTTVKAPTKSKTTQKAAPKATKKTPARPAKKMAAQKGAPKTQPVVKKEKQLSVKDILFQKFESMRPIAAASAAPKQGAMPPSAPPVITSTDPKDVARMRAILSEKFSMAEIIAAAKEPAPVVAPEASVAPATEPEPDVAPAAEPGPQAAAEKPVSKVAEESAYITTEPPPPDTTPDPVTRAAKIAIGLAAVVILLLLGISYDNSTKYYITPKDNAIEIWKGRFSPKDNKFYMVLHGTALTEPVKAVYSRKEIFPLIFNYYLDKADTLLEVPGLPDFDGIKDYLHQAEAYTVTSKMKVAVNSRLDTIERMILLYKADVAMSKGTIDSLQSAIKWLKQAGKLNPSAMQAEEIGAKITAAGESIAAIKAASAEKKTKKE